MSSNTAGGAGLQTEATLTFGEAMSIIVGHGVGSGILAVPYLASRNSWRDILLILAGCYVINLLLHFMIAELSLNNGGAQFIKCFERELFSGKAGKVLTWAAFAFLGLSVLVNVSGFIAGSAAVFSSWFGLPARAGMILYYVLASLAVFFGMKIVGICEKISVAAMVLVIAVLLGATLLRARNPMGNTFIASTNLIALYSTIAFSLSAVMSTPQVVKGLRGDAGKIRGSIAAGTGINAALLLLITFMTLLGTGGKVTENGALVDLAGVLGGWVGVVGFVFSLLALSTSFWANTLNLRDIFHEQFGLKNRVSYLVCSLPCLVIAMLGLQSFVGFTRLAGVVQILTGIGVIVAYHRSRKRVMNGNPVCGRFGNLAFEILVIAGSILSTAGAVLPVK